MIVGVDVGRYKVKVWYAGGFFDFYSNLGECREFEFKDEYGADDIIGEYQGRRFTGGTLAMRESEFGDSLMTESKLHEDTVILALIALHKIAPPGLVQMVTGLPVSDHERDKEEMKRILNGKHEITVNGATKRFIIQCEVAPEGSGVFKFADQGTVVRGIDIGSRTVNAITFRDRQKIGKESDTFDFGIESVKTKDPAAMARGIAAKTGALKWKKDDAVYLSGGGALHLANELAKFYPNAKVVNNSRYANAEAFFKIARAVYGRVHS